jgi:cytochrome P450
MMASRARSLPGSETSIPQGPRGLPYFGCLNGLLRNPMKFWSGIADTYGGIARVPLKGRHVYLVSDPTLLYELLVTNRHKYRKNIRYKAAVDTFGQGLLLTEGSAWKRQRLITQPKMKAEAIGLQIPSMAALTERLLERWERIADDGTVRNVDDDFLWLSQLQAGHHLLGSGFDAIEERFFSAAIAIKDNWPLPPRNILMLCRPRAKARERRLDAAIADIDECLRGYIADHRSDDFEQCGVLTTLARTSREQGDSFDDQSLRDQILTLFFAGHETSASSLSWIHCLLDQHPEVRSRLFREVDETLGGRSIRDLEDLDSMRYAEQVINESLRLYSPIHSISRVALEDDTLGGFPIDKGAMIYVSLYATHRLASLWPEPSRFDPERFTEPEIAGRPRFAFIPFAAGHRNCVGATMAMIELKLVMAQIAQRYRLRLAPGARVVPAAGTTMHPKYGMNMLIERRQATPQ